MIPNTLLGLVLFAASLGPGYVYLRVAEKRAPRADRSALVEAVEMVTLGGLFSLLAALVVLVLGHTTHALDTTALGKHANEYFLHHPVRGLGSLMLLFLLSYGGAAVSASIANPQRDAVVRPGSNAWQEAFWRRRPTPNHIAIVTIELRDGRKATGILGGFTTELLDSRELALHSPIAVQASPNAEAHETEDAFMVIREADVLYVAGRYHEGQAHAPPSVAQRLRARMPL